MTSTIKVDNIQNQCGANIIKEDSNTITLGASGDTDYSGIRCITNRFR